MVNDYFFKVILVFTLFTASLSYSQENFLVQAISDYEKYREPSLDERRIKYEDIQPLVKRFAGDPLVKVQKVGSSIEGRDLTLLSIGTGETDVFLWSQMHGDESTATMAIFDILNFLTDSSYAASKAELLTELKLHFLPMLNPDGAERFQRRNLLGIDVNRDALRLQSPEAKTLKRVRDSLDADFGFNLHDQSRYYNTQGTANPATISFLAPAYNEEKSVNEVREKAMKLIVQMNNLLQEEIPGMVGRYNDDFEPRAFGDNIQKWGTSTILIESGGYPEDPEKQEIRKLNFSAILAAIFSIANESYSTNSLNDYWEIPENDSKLYDLKLTGLKYDLLGDSYVLDLGINYDEVPTGNGTSYFYRGRIADQGDLSTNYAYKTIDVGGLQVKPGKIYPQVLADLSELKKIDFKKILSEGYAYIKVSNLPKNKSYTDHPILVVNEKFKPVSHLNPGANPTFFLEGEGRLLFAVINGFIYDLEDADFSVGNGLIRR